MIALVIQAAEIAIATIILYYVVPMIAAMPAHMQKIVQILIILVAILVVLNSFIINQTRASIPLPSIGGPIPSIIAPERNR